MGAHQTFEHAPSAIEQSDRALNTTRGPLNLLDGMSERLFAADMQRLFEISPSTFRRRCDRFNQFEILPRTGKRMWSRELLRAYFNGDLRPGAVFAKRHR